MSADSLDVLADKLSEPGALGGYLTSERLRNVLHDYIYRNGESGPMRELFGHWQFALVKKYYSYYTGLWRDVSI